MVVFQDFFVAKGTLIQCVFPTKWLGSTVETPTIDMTIPQKFKKSLKHPNWFNPQILCREGR